MCEQGLVALRVGAPQRVMIAVWAIRGVRTKPHEAEYVDEDVVQLIVRQKRPIEGRLVVGAVAPLAGFLVVKAIAVLRLDR